MGPDLGLFPEECRLYDSRRQAGSEAKFWAAQVRLGVLVFSGVSPGTEIWTMKKVERE